MTSCLASEGTSRSGLGCCRDGMDLDGMEKLARLA
jgi:hypothetical protein